MSLPGASYRGHDGVESLATVEQVFELIAEHARPLPAVDAPLHEAHRLVLAEDVLAACDDPPFDRAMVDGIALRAADVAVVPTDLRVIAEVSAGGSSDVRVESGCAVRINTGAPVPPGADCVVMVERTRTDTAERVSILAGEPAGGNIAPRGQFVTRGQLVLSRGTLLEAAQIGAAAAAGAARVRVHPAPTAALLVTGDEVTPAGASRRTEQIFDSNGPALAALLAECGARVVNVGIAPDDRATLRALMAAALQQPLAVIVGGMSMGTRDLVPGVLSEMGVRWLVHGVRMRPGRPMALGLGPQGQHVLGLPGNPAGAFTCCSLFGRAVLNRLRGLPAPQPRCIATLTEPIAASRDRRLAFVPGECRIEAGRLVVRPVAWGGSGDVFGLSRANALIHARRGDEPLAAGGSVDVTMYRPLP